jgi:hypothetical protein
LTQFNHFQTWSWALCEALTKKLLDVGLCDQASFFRLTLVSRPDFVRQSSFVASVGGVDRHSFFALF